MTTRIAIIGAGPGGLCTAIRLKQAGHDSFAILEKADGVGGTWWHNRYPGAACDIQSHLYSFSFAPKTDWIRPYATQPEILRYFEQCVAAYDLAPHLRLGCEVRAARWDDDDVLWRLETADGEEIVADVVVSAMGMFNELHWPAIPGLATFEGTVFHSARWDHDHDLTGARVGGPVGGARQGVASQAHTHRNLRVQAPADLERVLRDLQPTQWPHSMGEYESRTRRPDSDAYEVERGTATAG